MKGFSLLEGLLAFLVALGVLLHIVVAPDYSRRNVEFMPDMVRSPASKAQAPNTAFPDGLTLREPVAGTIARGHAPLMQAGALLDVATSDWKKLTPESQAAWDAFPAPWAAGALPEEQDAALLAEGAAIYQSICATCHGADGKGGTAVTQRGVPPPPSLLEEKYRAFSDGQLYRVITVGQANMPAHANQVTRNERWTVIRYIRQLITPKQ